MKGDTSMNIIKKYFSCPEIKENKEVIKYANIDYLDIVNLTIEQCYDLYLYYNIITIHKNDMHRSFKKVEALEDSLFYRESLLLEDNI